MWIDLSAGAALEASRVGGKAAGVARLHQAGLPVPDGWCLPVEAEPHAELTLPADATAWRRPLARLRATLVSTPPSAALRSAVQELCRCVEDAPLAVRSSAVGEAASLSGLLSTLLGARGVEAVLNAIQACWLSRWSDTAIRYALGRGLDLDQLRMGVLVQRMVPARAAGGARCQDGQVTVEGTWGLGRGLAEAEVIPDVWRAGELSPAPGTKPLAAELDPRGGETWRRLADDQATAPCLEAGTVVELSRLVRRAEQVFGEPVEVEWAVDEHRQAWLLQARPLPGARRPSGVELSHADRCVDGLPASGGQAVGRARVVRGAADLTRLGPHDVLVADRLAPGQLAGLTMLAGLVLEAGGTTSHAATLARERGIPAVFSARGATHKITDGAEVLVDGDAGRVLFSRPAAETATA